jgi:hypothetical protein
MANASSFLRRSVTPPIVPNNIAGITRPNASSIPEERNPNPGTTVAEDPLVEMVAAAVPVPFPAEMVPTEHVAAGLAAGAMLHVNFTPAESNPFDGVIVTVEVADCPDEKEDGETVEADKLKSAATLTALDVLALKLLSPV